MIIDKQTLMSDDQAITGDAASTNVIDLGADDSAIQSLVSRGLCEVWAQVTETFAGGTSLIVSLQTDSAVGFGTVETLLLSGVIAQATLVAGYRFRFGKLPVGTKRYLRMYYDDTGSFSSGKISAGLILDAQSNGHE